MITEKLKAEDKPVVQLVGGVATRNAFVVFDTATTEQLVAALGKVKEMEGATAWWMGDIGLALQERKRAELAGKAAELRKRATELDGSDPEQVRAKENLIEQAEELENGAEIKYREQLAEAFAINAGYLANCVSLARFYPPSFRNEGLTVAHHIEAMRGAKRDSQKIQEILKEAKDKGQTASEMRKELAEKNAVHRAPVAAAEAPSFTELAKADDWAKGFRTKLDTLTPAEAMGILSQMQELRALFTQLESIAKGMS